jgi:hypothetical protein
MNFITRCHSAIRRRCHLADLLARRLDPCQGGGVQPDSSVHAPGADKRRSAPPEAPEKPDHFDRTVSFCAMALAAAAFVALWFFATS